ncbi:MAG: hypothetical protein JSV31_24295 [Desulfobacterales bacterium]|nr:MAG: hypothetical protein JSV31_24295 [Desulfobacterales bacterium]
MKFYIAKMSEMDSDNMNYTQLGKSMDLYLKFPEFRDIINQYNLRSIDIRFVNGDRLRIYDINKGRPGIMNEKVVSGHEQISLTA